MRARRLLRAAILAMLAMPGLAHAGGVSTSAMGFATAVVIQPITVHQTADLDFGMLASGQGTPGAVTISATGASYSGGAAQICALSGMGGANVGGSCITPHAAGFAVSGEAGHAYSVSAPTKLTITGVADSGGPAPTLTIVGFTVTTASRPGAGTFGLIGADGTDSFVVGGTLALPATLQPARYRASFPVVVSYD